MDPRTFSFVIVFAGLVLLSFSSPLPESTALGDVTPSIDQEQVFLDCKNSDYRTYIKCLKRQKRQHLSGDRHGDADPHCMETCMKLCDGDQNCDSCRRCLKKTKHRHQIITEYETECSSGECKPTDNEPSVGSAHNFTTKIDINNVINTCTPGTPGCAYPSGSNTSHCCPECHPPTPCSPVYPSPPGVLPPFGGGGGGGILSQFQLVPQLTLGLGLAPSFSGWQYPSQWPYPPLPTNPIPNTHPVDCSTCGHPLLHYRCHVTCHPAHYYHHVSTNHTCHSPYCVGGTQG